MSTVISRDSVERPVRKAETVACPPLGGDVVVRQMTLTLFLWTLNYAHAHDNIVPIARILSDCVLDADGRPIFDESEWEIWSTAHIAAALMLYEKIHLLSGTNLEVAAKN